VTDANKCNSTKWEVRWSNGRKSACGKTLIDAVKKMDLTKKKNIKLGILVMIRHKGISSWWDSRQFIKHANLANTSEEM